LGTPSELSEFCERRYPRQVVYCQDMGGGYGCFETKKKVSEIWERGEQNIKDRKRRATRGRK